MQIFKLMIPALLWCGTISSIVSAQGTPSNYFLIEGNIYNTSEQLLKSAKIRIDPLGKEVKSKKGSFSLMLPVGTYMLQFVAEDYMAKRMAIVVKKDTVLRIVLSGNNGVHVLNTVDIVARKRGALAQKYEGLEYINKALIARIPTILGEKDVAKTLQLLPGVNAATDGSAETSVRGGSADQNLLLFNQIPLYNSQHLFGLLSAFNPLASEQAELYKGSIPSQYGGKIASVWKVSGLIPNHKKFSTTIELGLLSAKALVNTPIIKGESALVLAGRRSFLDLFSNFGASENESTLSFNDINGIYRHQINQKNTLLATFYSDKDKLYALSREGAGKTAAGGMVKQQHGASLIWDTEFYSQGYNKAMVYYSQYGSQMDEIRKSPSEADLNYHYILTNIFATLGFKDVIEYQANSKLQLQGGIEWLRESFRPSNFSNTEAGTTVSYRPQVFAPAAFTTSLFGEVNYTFEKNWLLSAGLRHMYYTSNGYTYNSPEPRLSVSKKVKSWDFGMSLSRITQTSQRLYNTGLSLPLDLFVPSSLQYRPQVAYQNSWRLAYQTQIAGQDYRFSVETYLKKLYSLHTFKDGYDLSSLVSNNSLNNTQNFTNILTTGNGNTIGAEIMTEKISGRLTGWVNYSYMNAKLQFAELNNNLFFAAPQQRTHVANIFLHYYLNKKISLSTTWIFQSGNPTTIPIAAHFAQLPNSEGALSTDTKISIAQYGPRNAQNTLPYHRLDLNIKYDLKLGKLPASLNIGLFNAYNRANASFYFTKPSESKNSVPQVHSVSALPILPSVSFKITL